MTSIRAVAFDLMGTVFHDPFREALDAAMPDTSVEELHRRRDARVYPAFERGDLDEAAYWQHFEEVGIRVEPAAFHAVRRRDTVYLPGMDDLLDDLEGTVVRATASNYPVWIEELAAGLLRGRFEHVIASYHLGARKPDEDFYARLLDALGLAPHEVAFVDDRPANVDAAQSLGMPAQLFAGAEALRAWLAGLGVAVTVPERVGD